MTCVFIARASDFSDGSNERSAAYRLLKYALDELGYDGEKTVSGITKTAYGKPVSNAVQFSLSHSKGLVAVAISSLPVGVDVETLYGRKITDFSFALAAGEKVDGSEKFLSLWTKKEAIFKRLGDEKRFKPKTICAERYFTETRFFTVDDKLFALSVATKDEEKVRFTILL